MSYTIINKFAQYKVDQSTEVSAKVWDSKDLYKTNYLLLSGKNPLALSQSTTQLLKTKSSNLRAVSAIQLSENKKLNNSAFIEYDYDNQYRTSYHEMTNKKPVLIRNYFIPKYKGFIPGIKSENPFGENFCRVADKQIKKFDDHRFMRETNETYKDWQYNPLSKNIGNFYKNKTFVDVLSKTINNHTYTDKLRDSGYSKNLISSKQSSGWLNKSLNGDMIRSEYRINFNNAKEVHYKQPMFSKGILKAREYNYKHN